MVTMEIMGRGFKQILQESPLYFHLGLKMGGYKLFKRKSPLYGSADIINVCNLHCEHCYWWLNRKENEELTVEQWKKVIDEILNMKSNGYKDYIINPVDQLEIMKRNWGGKGTTPVDCPTWAIVSVDHMGREKRPCCIGSAENDSMKPICEECGLGCYSVLIGYGIKGD